MQVSSVPLGRHVPLFPIPAAGRSGTLKRTRRVGRAPTQGAEGAAGTGGDSRTMVEPDAGDPRGWDLRGPRSRSACERGPDLGGVKPGGNSAWQHRVGDVGGLTGPARVGWPTGASAATAALLVAAGVGETRRRSVVGGGCFILSKPGGF